MGEGGGGGAGGGGAGGGGAGADWSTAPTGRLGGWRATFNLERVSGDPEGVQRGQKMNARDKSIRFVAPGGKGGFASRQAVAAHFGLQPPPVEPPAAAAAAPPPRLTAA